MFELGCTKFRIFQEAIVDPFCGEGEDVVGVHTLLSGVVQVCHEILVGEEEEKEEEQGRQEEREIERGGQGEETAHMDDHVDECEKARLKLEPNVWMRSR